MAPKTKPKKALKRQIVETKQIQEPFKVETKEDSVSELKNEKEEDRTIPPETQQPSKKLEIVRQASISSQEGLSIKQSQREKKSTKSVNEPKKEVAPIQQESIKQEDMPYDQFNVLKISGLLDAYEHFLKLLCKNGLPTGRIYEYAAQEIQKYERKKINKELRMRAELDIQKISKRAEQISPSPEKPRNSSPYYS